VTAGLPTTFAVVHLCSEQVRQWSAAQETARQGARGIIPARPIYCRRRSTSSPRSRRGVRQTVLETFRVLSSILLLPLPLHSHLTTIQPDDRDDSLVLRLPANYRQQQNSVCAKAHQTAMLDCLRGARVNLHPSVATEDVTVHQVLVASVIDSEILFLRYVVQNIHQRYRMTCPLY
jgi:hypothetical protein